MGWSRGEAVGEKGWKVMVMKVEGQWKGMGKSGRYGNDKALGRDKLLKFFNLNRMFSHSKPTTSFKLKSPTNGSLTK